MAAAAAAAAAEADLQHAEATVGARGREDLELLLDHHLLRAPPRHDRAAAARAARARAALGLELARSFLALARRVLLLGLPAARHGVVGRGNPHRPLAVSRLGPTESEPLHDASATCAGEGRQARKTGVRADMTNGVVCSHAGTQTPTTKRRHARLPARPPARPHTHTHTHVPTHARARQQAPVLLGPQPDLGPGLNDGQRLRRV